MASYDLSRITGKQRTNAPTVMLTVACKQDATRIATAIKRDDTDSREFRAMRSLMRQSHGVCG